AVGGCGGGRGGGWVPGWPAGGNGQLPGGGGRTPGAAGSQGAQASRRSGHPAGGGTPAWRREMPEVTDPYAPGTPCWIDLMVPDQQAALDFYRDLFGWQGEVGPEEYGGYAVCTQRGRPVAGVMQARAQNGEGIPRPSWTTSFASGDIGSSESRIVDEGGALLVPPMQVGELGWMMVAADPQGAVFGLWQAKDFPGAGIVNEHGALTWNQLITTEV